MILRRFQFSAPFVALARVVVRGREFWSLGGLYSALRGEICAPSLAAKFVFPPGRRAIPEGDFGSRRLSPVRGSADRDAPSRIGEDSTTSLVWRSEGHTLARNIGVFIAPGGSARLRQERMFGLTGEGQARRRRPRARH